jgi:molybdate transport system substrate-binding protein
VREINLLSKSLVAFPLLIIAACASLNGFGSGFKNEHTDPQGSLTVFAAASLIEAFNEIGESYEAANPGVQITLNYAGSQQLAQQLSQGAPADVFASADKEQMDNVISSGRVLQGMEVKFVRNRLLIIVPEDNPGQIQDFGDLSNPGLEIILADGAVPVGRYSLQMLSRASQSNLYGDGFKQDVLNNAVSYEENVRAVLSKVILGEADAGIVYVSDGWGINAEEVRLISIPDQVNISASYYISPVSDSSNQGLAQDFIEFVLSPESQDILARYGFDRQGHHV